MAEVGVTVVFAAEVVAFVLGAFVGVVGSFDAASDLLVFVAAENDLSFFSTASKNKEYTHF